MRNLAIFCLLALFGFQACKASGYKDQTWRPKDEKKMKRGKNGPSHHHEHNHHQ